MSADIGQSDSKAVAATPSQYTFDTEGMKALLERARAIAEWAVVYEKKDDHAKPKAEGADAALKKEAEKSSGQHQAQSETNTAVDRTQTDSLNPDVPPAQQKGAEKRRKDVEKEQKRKDKEKKQREAAIASAMLRKVDRQIRGPSEGTESLSLFIQEKLSFLTEQIETKLKEESQQQTSGASPAPGSGSAALVRRLESTDFS